MPAAPEAFLHLGERIRDAKTRADQDDLLDVWSDYRDRATEWDAGQWHLEAAGKPFELPDGP